MKVCLLVMIIFPNMSPTKPLLGESTPVLKSPITDESLKMIDLTLITLESIIGRHVLYSGTRIIKSQKPQIDDYDGESASLALVIRTGSDTSNGALVRSILFPKPSKLRFVRDTAKYLFIMVMIAITGMVISFTTLLLQQVSPDLRSDERL